MKVYSILQTLSKEEWHWLVKFADSPIFNKHSEVRHLLDFLRKKIALEIPEKLAVEQAESQVFNNDKAKFHHVSNYLLNCIEQFLAWQEYGKDESVHQYFLLKSYQNHGLETQFKGTLDKFKKKRQSQPHRSPHFYRMDYLLQYEDYQYYLRQGRAAPFNLQELSAVHDIGFIAEKLKIACILASHQRVATMDYDTGLLQFVLDFVEKNQHLLEIPPIGVYFHGYKTSVEPDNDMHYQSLRKRFVENTQCFTVIELNDIYLLLVNYCIRRHNLGNKKYSLDAFNWYKSGFDAHVFVQNGRLPRFTYSNTVALGLAVGEYEWVIDFIETHKQFLQANHREGVYSFNLARYFFYKKDYKKALPLLLTGEHDDPLHVIVAKNLLLKVFYETKEITALYNHLDSFTSWLKRKKNLGYQRDNSLNIIKIIQKLLSLQPSDKKGKMAIEQEIATAKPLSERDWLLEQLKKV